MAQNTTEGNVSGTTPPPGPRMVPPNPQLIEAFNWFNVAVVTAIMLAMGCTLKLRELIRVLKQPSQIDRRFFVGVAIGFLCQFIVLPLVGFGLAHALQYSSMTAMGALVVSCCPGGTTSNILTFWNRGDVALSVTMTTLSTVLAMGMMPLNLWLYSRSWTHDVAVVPYKEIVTTLAMILIPVAVGMLIKFWFEKLAKVIVLIGSVIGLLGITTTFVLSVIINPSMFKASWNVWVGALLLPVIGGVLGYGISCAPFLQLSHSRRRAIALETGVQHVTLAVAIIQLTFAQKKQFLSELLVFPMLYAPFLIVLGLAVTGIFRLWLVATGQNKNPETGGDKFAENQESTGNPEKNGVANIVAMEIDDEVHKNRS
ncbi:ileal sodium/bile acid cotransporter-like [Branchiostoma lanceolatum]|uniref:ileal sodium/bile acid cotransporter-like n=1 Tax=Branchiostoma lanceolatum TaxID=7740 RepID=UPI0011330F1F